MCLPPLSWKRASSVRFMRMARGQRVRGLQVLANPRAAYLVCAFDIALATILRGHKLCAATLPR